MKTAPIILIFMLALPAVMNSYADGTDDDSTNFLASISKYVDVEVGTIILRPFNVKTNSLTTDDTAARVMLSGVFQTREAWRDDNFATNGNAFSFLGIGKSGTNWTWSPTDLLPKDFELQLGYAFGGSSSDGSAAAGSGDAFGETSIGWDWFKIVQEPTNPWSPIYTVGPEIFGGFNSDSSFHRLHYDYGVGVAFVAGLPIDSDPNRPKLELMSRVGYAGVDSMTYGDTHDVVQMSGSVPVFDQKPALQIECEARLPIIKPGALGEFGYLSVGGAFYKIYDNAPDTWTMYVAISIPLKDLLKAIPTPNIP